MEDLLSRIWEKGNNPFIRAIGLFIIVLFAVLGIVSVISDTGFATEIQQYRVAVWIGSLIVALVVAVGWLVIYLRQQRTNLFLRDAQSKKIYLRDHVGKAREVPDDDTYSFLVDALSFYGDVSEVPTENIRRIRGDKITSVKKWERPLTPDEKAKKEQHHQVRGQIDKARVKFEENVSPQKIVIEIANLGKMLLSIKRVRFQPNKLSETALISSYEKAGASYVGIPFNEKDSHFGPRDIFTVELELRQKWDVGDIDRLRGEMGFLVLDIAHGDELVEGIIVNI